RPGIAYDVIRSGTDKIAVDQLLLETNDCILGNFKMSSALRSLHLDSDIIHLSALIQSKESLIKRSDLDAACRGNPNLDTSERSWLKNRTQDPMLIQKQYLKLDRNEHGETANEAPDLEREQQIIPSHTQYHIFERSDIAVLHSSSTLTSGFYTKCNAIESNMRVRSAARGHTKNTNPICAIYRINIPR
ncbi:hypothetical protein K469DRAFT_772608, partial [Zopfia rhizophila CBS 207.26]